MSDDELENGDENGEENGLPDEFKEQLGQVVDEHFSKKEREDAQDLIRDAFAFLPMELQDLYHDIQLAYRAGKFEEASKLFEQWLGEARDLGLI
ncbi:MAG TPA: hypothetical protein VN363_02015 [Anaerolineales bacterium]|nr:hypothetical protein [Anaerolineales bacterium]